MDRALVDWYRRFPEGWWGYHWALPRPMSAVEIVASGSMDGRLMALIWAVMDRRRGLMLASEAPQAGKTTTLSAAVDFLPEQTVGVFLRGWARDLSWTDEIGPERGFVLVNEMSDHLPIYVWGANARAALELAGQGYGFGGTMHADSLEEGIACLTGELGAAERDLAGLTLYLQYSAYRTPRGMYRRVEEAWHLRLGEDGSLQPIRLAAIDGDRSPRLTGAQRLPVPPTLATDGGRAARPLIHDPGAYAALAATLGIAPGTLEQELADRAAFLAALDERGICDPPSVAMAVTEYEGATA
jgi:hypothetical protein